MVRFRKRHTVAGARPGTLVIPADAPLPRLRLTSYDEHVVEEREIADVADPAKRRATYQDILDAPVHMVAEIVDGNPTTVKVQVHRARRALRETLAQRLDDGKAEAQAPQSDDGTAGDPRGPSPNQRAGARAAPRADRLEAGS